MLSSTSRGYLHGEMPVPNVFNSMSLKGQRMMSTANSPPKHGNIPVRPDTEPMITKTFLPRRDVLLGIVPSTKFSDGLKGRSCTLHQRSSSESVSGSDHSHEIASVEVPSTSSHLRRERLESGKWEGLSGQQLAWLEQQEIKPGHFTEAYVRNLGSSSRPLFSLKKMEVRGSESRSRVPSNVKERERKGNSERRKNISTAGETSSRISSQRSSTRQQEDPGVEQVGIQFLPDGSSVINIPHGRNGEHPVHLEAQTELDKLKSELQSQSKDQDSGKSTKKKSGSKSSSAAFTKSPSRKSTPAKSKVKKPPSGNSSQVKGQLPKPARAKPTGSKVKRKKTVKKTSEKDEGTDAGGLKRGGGEESTRTDHSLHQKSEMTEEHSTIETVMDREAIEGSLSRQLRGSLSSSWEIRQQSRADERRLEVERKRADKRRLQQEQQQEEEERLRLQAEVETAREEAARVMNTDNNYGDIDFKELESDQNVEAFEEARKLELERLEALQAAMNVGEDVPRLREEELERLMREREMTREAERLQLEGERLRLDEERLRKEEERIERLKMKQEAEEHRKQEEAFKAQEEIMRWKQELESAKRDSTIQESIARLQSEIELAKLDALNVKRFEGTVLSEPTYFSYFRYCPKLFEGLPKQKTERGKRGKRPQSTLSK